MTTQKERLDVKADQRSLAQVLVANDLLRVPKYQRRYAWEEEDEIDDFLKDLERSYRGRLNGVEVPRFFGGIVTAREKVDSDIHTQDGVQTIIDGQQRLTTVTITLYHIERMFLELVELLSLSGVVDVDPEQLREFCRDQAKQIRMSYLVKKIPVGTRWETLPKLEMTRTDNLYLQKLINPDCVDITNLPDSFGKLPSHTRIQHAFNAIGKWFDDRSVGHLFPRDQADNLMHVLKILENDWTVVHMSTGSRHQSYMLFQALNDRGKNLTPGELLRSRTLELLEPFSALQTSADQMWEEVLVDEPNTADRYLGWVVETHAGSRAQPRELFDDIMDAYFAGHEAVSISQAQAELFVSNIKLIRDRMNLIRGFAQSSEWPYPPHSSVTTWQERRLFALVDTLKHTRVIPLLVAATETLTPKRFAEVVAMVERFFFRYKTISRGHISRVSSIYRKHIDRMRTNGKDYDIEVLRTDLNKALSDGGDVEVFRAGLAQIRYYNNPNIRSLILYFLTTIESYSTWAQTGVSTSKKKAHIPIASDPLDPYIPSRMTIEHVASQSSISSAQDEDLYHSLGNLTVATDKDQQILGSKAYSEKKEIYAKSGRYITSMISTFDTWDAEQIRDRQNILIEIAEKVFVP